MRLASTNEGAPVVRMAMLISVFLLIGSVAFASGKRQPETALLSTYLSTAFGAAPVNFDARERAELHRWGAWLRKIDYRAPPHGDADRLFAIPRAKYLRQLLDRPELLAALPEYTRLKRALALPPPRDNVLLVALENLKRGGTPGAAVLRWIRRLAAQGFRFTFPDLGVLRTAYRRQRWRALLQHPGALRAALEHELGGRGHAARRGSNLTEGAGNLTALSRVDWLRMRCLLDALKRSAVQARLESWIRRAHSQRYEIGGTIALQHGRARWRTLPSAMSKTDRYKLPPQPRYAVRLAVFHLHASAADDRPAAGPSLMDAFSAAWDSAPHVVVTDLGHGRFDVDYYRSPQARGSSTRSGVRLWLADVDLGVFGAGALTKQ